MTRKLTAIIEREGDGYVALCPEVDVVSQGDSVSEARDNLEEALALFFETASTEEIEGRARRSLRDAGRDAGWVNSVFFPTLTSVGSPGPVPFRPTPQARKAPDDAAGHPRPVSTRVPASTKDTKQTTVYPAGTRNEPPSPTTPSRSFLSAWRVYVPFTFTITDLRRRHFLRRAAVHSQPPGASSSSTLRSPPLSTTENPIVSRRTTKLED